uniref:(northern house mosquito) hypothetical protein n=1 Tax=Culex pipiens TaxID=7175 RepID=A0A8D8A9S1_CULPI
MSFRWKCKWHNRSRFRSSVSLVSLFTLCWLINSSHLSSTSSSLGKLYEREREGWYFIRGGRFCYGSSLPEQRDSLRGRAAVLTLARSAALFDGANDLAHGDFGMDLH